MLVVANHVSYVPFRKICSHSALVNLYPTMTNLQVDQRNMSSNVLCLKLFNTDSNVFKHCDSQPKATHGLHVLLVLMVWNIYFWHSLEFLLSCSKGSIRISTTYRVRHVCWEMPVNKGWWFYVRAQERDSPTSEWMGSVKSQAPRSSNWWPQPQPQIL